MQSSWLALRDLWALCELDRAWSQGVIMVELDELTKLMQIMIWICGRKAQPRKDGAH